MSENIQDNKRIAKNTLLLYVRMLISIIVGLYTSRIVLKSLGVDDYGIFNVVGGIVSMMAFMNAAMTQASQRFIAFELGTKNSNKLKLVFCTSVIIHVVIALIVILICETFGLWFLNNMMNIAKERMYAANCVYQSAIITFICTIISVPYNACIVAHEHLKAFAYISIIETIMRLLVAFLLLMLNTDRLIAYSILLATTSILIRFLYGFYCKRNFNECIFNLMFDKQLFKKMFSFAGWSLLGSLGFSFKDQAANIILNIFCGTSINAARGIALQVNGVISNFSNSFIMALNPQITKQYACNNIEYSVSLVYLGCRYSFFLLSLITIPVILNIDYLLNLWLSEVPTYTAEFLTLALVAALISSLAGPLVTAIQATGYVKVFQIVICLVMLSELPLAFFMLKLGFKPYQVMYPTIIVTFIGVISRFYILQRIVKAYSFSYFISNILLRNIVIIFICFLASKYVHGFFQNNFSSFLVTSIISFVITCLGIFFLGMTKNERINIYKKISNFIVNIK